MQGQGFKVLLQGPSGSGKTLSLCTAALAGLEVFIIFTENGAGVLPRAKEIYGLDGCKSGIHYRYIAPAAQSWNSLLQQAKLINSFDQKTISGLAATDKKDFNQFYEMLGVMVKPICQKCGKEFECVDNWGQDMLLGFDSLSGLNIMAWRNMIGGKVTSSPGEYGIAMNQEEQFIQRCCFNLNCNFVLTAHQTRQVDEIYGGITSLPDALGKALSPKLPRFFDEVIQTVKRGDKFFWSNAETGVDLKNRSLPLSNELKPTFELLIDNWKKNLEVENEVTLETNVAT